MVIPEHVYHNPLLLPICLPASRCHATKLLFSEAIHYLLSTTNSSNSSQTLLMSDYGQPLPPSSLRHVPSDSNFLNHLSTWISWLLLRSKNLKHSHYMENLSWKCHSSINILSSSECGRKHISKKVQWIRYLCTHPRKCSTRTNNRTTAEN